MLALLSAGKYSIWLSVYVFPGWKCTEENCWFSFMDTNLLTWKDNLRMDKGSSTKSDFIVKNRIKFCMDEA